VWEWVLSANTTFFIIIIIIIIIIGVLSKAAPLCNVHVLSLSLFLIMIKDWPLGISCSWLRYEFLFGKRCQAFLFHTFTFAVWLVMVDPCFSNSDSVTYKGVTFLVVPVRAVTPLQRVMPVLFHEMFGNTSCTNLLEVKYLVNYFRGRTMTNLQLVYHFIISHPPVVAN
jgi:hypothetical protein